MNSNVKRNSTSLFQNFLATNVICINNMVDPIEIENDSIFEEIYEDIKEEISKIGAIRSMIIPRKRDGYLGTCLGKVYIEFENINAATMAVRILGVKLYFQNELKLQDYKYDNRSLQASYYEPNRFMERILI
jgi:RNA recognition motif-containing protein